MEQSRFFDSVNGDRVYPASAFSEFFAAIINTGVQSFGTNLQVLEVPGTMQVEIQPGMAWIDGHFYMVDTGKLQLTIEGADPTDLRYDRIVLRLDMVNRELTAKVLKGIADVNPVVPALTRTNDVFEISLAKIDVTAGKSYLEQSQITDERSDDAVCGQAGLLVNVESVPGIEAKTDLITITQPIDLDQLQSDLADIRTADGALVIQTVTADPATPVTGQIWLRTDL